MASIKLSETGRVSPTGAKKRPSAFPKVERMDDKHLQREEFWELVKDERIGDRELAVLHLVVCERCFVDFREVTGDRGQKWLKGRLGSWDFTPWTAGQREKLPERFSVLSRNEIRGVFHAEGVAVELMALPRPERLLKAANLDRYRFLALGLELLRQAKGHWSDEPGLAEETAETAVAVFTSCLRWGKAGTTGSTLVQDCLARSWGSVGNARRVQGRLALAERALAKANVHLKRGSGAPEDRGWWYRYRAALLKDQRRFEAARSACEAAAREFQAAQLPRDKAWMTVQRAVIEACAGNRDLAIELYERFLSCSSLEEVGVDVYRVAQHNLAKCLAEAGLGAQARGFFEEVRGWVMQAGTAFGIRARWTEGLILEAEERLSLAAEAYSEVQEHFIENEVPYDAALVSLDLVRVQLQMGRSGTIRQLADTLEQVFLTQGIHREATMVGLLVVDALRHDVASVELVRRIGNYFRETRTRQRSGQ